MIEESYDVVIAGAGAGGATLARELSREGKRVLVAERGKFEEKVGTVRDALGYYDLQGLLQQAPQSPEGVKLWRALLAGGSTMITLGNATRCLGEDLKGFGIDLEDAFQEAEADLGVNPLNESFLSDGTSRVMEAALALGYPMEFTPKCIDLERCTHCGNCQLGCSQGAKWSAVRYLEEAVQNGAEIATGWVVEKVLIENGRAAGLVCRKGNQLVNIRGETTILAAGGIGTPAILQRSGFEQAGEGLFMDLLVNVYGLTDDVNMLAEPPMSLVNLQFHESEGFILSTYIAPGRAGLFLDLGAEGMTLPIRRLIGLMVKTSDESAGRVHADGSFSKPVTDRDLRRLDAGAELAREILIKAGAREDAIIVSGPGGAHPGGTAAIGRVVDRSLQTEVPGLHICDGSVLPHAPGLPTMLTIIALGKWLSRRLLQ
ncbi:MAG: GMC family oxidoreductase [Anaerolineales bacterium]|nr:GMC family oxidoreductase [Anaerolineales bacterium]